MTESDSEAGRPGVLDGALSSASTAPGRRRKRSRRRLSGCLPVLLVLAVVIGLGYVGVTRGVDFLESQFGEPEDYPGPGTGSVSFQVESGDSIAQMGRNLVEADVVASVDAFTDAASRNPDSTGIQVGSYPLMEQMRAADVVAILVDPSNIVSTNVTIPEGLRVVDIVDILVEQTDFPRRAFLRVLNRPDSIGLPAYADGDAEGYLFPATYGFGPDATPTSMLTAMVSRWEQAAADAGLEEAAERLGYTPHELMTIASLVEAEARPVDMSKVARVIYNRLENPENGITNGLLQIDATVNYALGRNLGLQISQEDLNVDSPYNTRRYAGLPPGPIEAPGQDALDATVAPAQGDWLFYVTVNPDTGETKFTADFDEFNRFAQEFRDFCSASPDVC